MALVLGAPVPLLHGDGRTAVAAGPCAASRGRVEAQREGGEAGGLVLLGRQQVVAPGVPDLAAAAAVAEAGVAGQHPPAPSDPRQQRRGDRHCRLGFVGGPGERFLGQDKAWHRAHGGARVDRATARLAAPPPALRLAVPRHPRPAARLGVGHRTRLAVRGHRVAQPIGGQPGEAPLAGGLTRGAPSREPEGREDDRGRARTATTASASTAGSG